ncbi:APC family permease [Brachybacterium muris]|uniref:APC family permease n=1 Tax=Brachybacterium muris TaxID=219301 RepID=UPI0021A7FFEA|nr:APC family permease [Brachybacterium muris]
MSTPATPPPPGSSAAPASSGANASGAPASGATASGAPGSGQLARRLGLGDAVVIGLASMIGAGVFVALGAAQDLAGPAVLLAVGLAALVAFGNATSTAQLAAQYPTSGGTYFFGRQQLGPWWGFLAGWCFVIGKTASCAAMAMVVAAYLVPEGFQRPIAAAVVVLLTAVNLVGVTRTAGLARILVTIALVALALTAARLLVGVAAGDGGAAFGAPVPGPLAGRATGFWDGGLAALLGAGDGGALGTVLAIAQAAAVVFFAFAGYARVATLGEEVTAPRRTIPRAILLALGAVFALYIALAAVLVLVGPAPGEQGWGPAPFIAALDLVGAGAVWKLVVTVGAAAAAAGALLALVAGVSRTMLGMAREGDLPRPLAHVSERYSVPQRAEITVGIAVVLLVLLASDVLVAITASAFGVLLYYAVANIAAYTQTGEHRLFPKALQVMGLIGCILLVAALPGSTLVAGLALVAAGLVYRGIVLASRR